MKKLIKFAAFLSLFALLSCGFKATNNILYSKFFIENIESSGSKKIDFFVTQGLKNKLSNKEAINKITLKITNEAERKINEKNIQNKITKYEIILNTDVNIIFLNNLESKNIKVSSKGIYNVETAHIDTKSNRQNLEKFLVNKNIEQILKELINLK
tara:strand:+ start:3471 stop:3938 length:468 start_codon:yes stop_codon:yes gene_type:complete